MPAPDIEALVVDAVRELLLDPSRIADALGTVAPDLAPGLLGQAIERAAVLAVRLADPTDPDGAAIVRRLVTRVTVAPTSAQIIIDRSGLAASLLKGSDREGGDGDDQDASRLEQRGDDRSATGEPTEPDGTALAPLVIERAIQLRRQRRQQRLVVGNAAPEMAGPDAAMIRAVVRAHAWFAMLRDRQVDSIADLGRRERVARHR